MLKYKGAACFRQRIVCSTLTSRPVYISHIHEKDKNPGIKDYEANFLRLMEKFTNGCVVEINEEGTAVKYTPGIILGGTITHDCGISRAIGYFLEPLMCMAPFAKTNSKITLNGITNDDTDVSVDVLRTATATMLQQFGLDDVIIKVLKRGAPPKGGGSILFTCSIVRELTPISITEAGKVRRVRGIAYATRLSPQTSNRVIEGTRSIMGDFCPDIFINVEHTKGTESGLSPGFGLTLLAETTTGCIISVEKMGGAGVIPEDLGKEVAKLLLEEVFRGGCTDSTTQSVMLLFMALCPEDVSKLRLGPLSDYTVQILRQIKDFFGVTFKITPDPETKTIMYTCLGSGFKNLAKKTT